MGWKINGNRLALGWIQASMHNPILASSLMLYKPTFLTFIYRFPY